MLQSNITTRLSLRWLPDPPFETTDTLVLAVGEWYVDLRVDKEFGEIDWALAGQCQLKDISPRMTRIKQGIKLTNINWQVGLSSPTTLTRTITST